MAGLIESSQYLPLTACPPSLAFTAFPVRIAFGFLITCECLNVSLVSLCTCSRCLYRCVSLFNLCQVISHVFGINLVLWINIYVHSLEAASSFLNACKATHR